MSESTTEQSSREKEAYEMVDRFLRNNLSDMDYADYSQALDLLSTRHTLSGQTAQSGWNAGNTTAPGDFSEEIAALPAQAMGEKTTERGAELEAVQRDAMRFAWIAKHFTHIGGVYVKDHEVKTFAFRCDDDAPMGDEADADRLRNFIDSAIAAAPQKGEAE